MPRRSDLPSFENYFVPTVDCLKARGDSMTISEMEEDVATAMKLSDELLSVPHGDGHRTQFQYELAWVRTYLKKVGALDNSERGVWRLTPTGASMSHADIRAVPRQVRELEKQERKARKAQQDGPNEEDEEPDEQDWREQLLDVMRSLEPDAFERLAQRLLRESGFTKVEVTGRSGDGGIDGTGVLRVNLLSFHVLFQCKRYSGTVGAGVVRDFRGAMVGRADKGLIITTGTFSPDAKREATRDGAPALDLVDGDTLCDLLKQLGIGVSVKQVEEVEIDKSAFVDI
ncbi:MAG: restriction endonuclease [Pseudomonadota bacterium]